MLVAFTQRFKCQYFSPVRGIVDFVVSSLLLAVDWRDMCLS